MKKLLILTIILSIGLLTLGIATSAFGACLGCPDWPLCYGSILPPENFVAKLEYYHRLLAGIVGIFSLVIGFLYFNKQRILAIMLMFLIISQIILGGITVILKMPFIISILHSLFGILTYLTLLMISNDSYKFQKNIYSLMFLILFLYYMWNAVVDKTSSQLACENLSCFILNINEPKVIIQAIFKILGLLIILISAISLFNFSIDKLILFILSILIFISSILIIKSLLSVSMVLLHYVLLLSALSLSLIKSLKKETLKTLEV